MENQVFTRKSKVRSELFLASDYQPSSAGAGRKGSSEEV